MLRTTLFGLPDTLFLVGQEEQNVAHCVQLTPPEFFSFQPVDDNELDPNHGLGPERSRPARAPRHCPHSP